MSKIQARWHVDSGHGWLEVPTTAGIKYGTGYGYVSPDGSTVFLEEDCEAGLFLRDNENVDMLPEIVYHGDATCRMYRRIPNKQGV